MRILLANLSQELGLTSQNEDLGGDALVVDNGDQTRRAPATRAGQDVDREDPLE